MSEYDEIPADNGAARMREEIGSSSFTLMDAMDADFKRMIDTYTEHVMLMVKELTERGIERTHALALITSFTVTAAVEAPFG